MQCGVKEKWENKVAIWPQLEIKSLPFVDLLFKICHIVDLVQICHILLIGRCDTRHRLSICFAVINRIEIQILI